jgi:hypothetical protein
VPRAPKPTPRLPSGRKLWRADARRQLVNEALESKCRALLQRDRACQIINRAARCAEKEDFRPRAEGIQEPSGLLETNRCRGRPDDPDVNVDGLGDICARFEHTESRGQRIASRLPAVISRSFPDSMPGQSTTAAPRSLLMA